MVQGFNLINKSPKFIMFKFFVFIIQPFFVSLTMVLVGCQVYLFAYETFRRIMNMLHIQQEGSRMACKTSMNEMNSHYIFCILHYVSISFRHKKICRSIRVNGLRTYISFSQKNLCQFCYSIMKFNVLISELSHENENENKSLICSGTSFSYIFQYI